MALVAPNNSTLGRFLVFPLRPARSHQCRQSLLRSCTHWRAADSFFGVDLPFHFAHRFFIASEIRLRAAELIVRLYGLVYRFRNNIAIRRAVL